MYFVQDNYDALGMPSTAGAVAFEDNFPTIDGTPVRPKSFVLLLDVLSNEGAHFWTYSSLAITVPSRFSGIIQTGADATRINL